MSRECEDRVGVKYDPRCMVLFCGKALSLSGTLSECYGGVSIINHLREKRGGYHASGFVSEMASQDL